MQLGLAQLVTDQLIAADWRTRSLMKLSRAVAAHGAALCAALTQHQPDWIIGLGGGSCLDAAKAAWLLYENPGIELASVNPFDHYTLRRRQS